MKYLQIMHAITVVEVVPFDEQHYGPQTTLAEAIEGERARDVAEVLRDLDPEKCGHSVVVNTFDTGDTSVDNMSKRVTR